MKMLYTPGQVRLSARQRHHYAALNPVELTEEGHSWPSRRYATVEYGWLWRVPRFMVFAVGCVLLASLLWLGSAEQTPLWTDPAIQPQHGAESLDISWPIHPQEHIGRQSRTIVHQWNITSGWRRPDGVNKVVYLVNDQFPGPTIEAAPGDYLELQIHNGLPNEGIAIHWHGLHMRGANNMDGAVSITQNPIAPGHNFTYNFEIAAHQHGTFWYHAHDRVQRADGLYGGLIVHDKSKKGLIERDRLLLISDWYHQGAQKVLDRYLEPGAFGNEPVPDSIILNEKGAYNCSDASPARPVDCVDTPDSAIPVLVLEPGRRNRFRIVNTGTLAGFTFALPGINMSAVEIDGGQQIKASVTDRIGVLYPGQRLDITIDVMRAHKTYLEIELDEENFRDPNPALTGTQRFPVEITGIQTHADDEVLATIEPLDLSTTTSWKAPEADFPVDAHHMLVIYMNTMKFAHRANLPFGYINQTSWRPQERPLLSMSRSQWDENQLVPFIPVSGTNDWVDLVINNIDDGGHPFHLHGYTFFVLQVSQKTSFWGSYNPFKDDIIPQGPLNLQNPIRRDTVFVPARGYVVLRFKADNEGLWFAHCHILSHQAAGMAMTFQVGGDEELGFS